MQISYILTPHVKARQSWNIQHTYRQNIHCT